MILLPPLVLLLIRPPNPAVTTSDPAATASVPAAADFADANPATAAATCDSAAADFAAASDTAASDSSTVNFLPLPLICGAGKFAASEPAATTDLAAAVEFSAAYPVANSVATATTTESCRRR